MLWKAVINKKTVFIEYLSLYVPVKQKVQKHIIAIKTYNIWLFEPPN